MKIILLMAAALLLATPAWAGGVDCGGMVSMEDAVFTVRNREVSANVECKVADKALTQRFLKVCPVGSQCFIWLGDGHRNYYRDADNTNTLVITKWPAGNKDVERINP